jgi:hypothetical protein
MSCAQSTLPAAARQVSELRSVWPPLRDAPEPLLVAITAYAAEWDSTACSFRDQVAGPVDAKRRRVTPLATHSPGGDMARARVTAQVTSACLKAPPSDALVRDALSVLLLAREAGTPPVPSHLATCLRVLQRASGPPVEMNLPSGPRERLAALARSNVPGECVMTARLLAIWAELGQWRRSAAQKASAIECWSRASALANVSPWPPAEGGFAVFALVCKSDRSLQKYCSYLRAVLRLLRCQLGVLGDTSGIVRGAEKANIRGASTKFKARATASQARPAALLSRRA